MDIEQLKLILETVNAAGEGAYTIALLWLFKSYFETLAFAGVVIYALKVFNKLIRSINGLS